MTDKVTITDEQQALFEQSVQFVKRKLVHPLLLQDPELKPQVGLYGTAHIQLDTHQCEVAQKFIDELVEQGCSPEAAYRGILFHELKHYTRFPRDHAAMLYLLHHVERKWPVAEHGNMFAEIFNIYADVIVDCDSLTSSYSRDDAVEMQRAFVRLLQKPGKEGKIPPQGVGIASRAVYQGLTGLDIGVTVTEEGLDDIVKELMRIDYFIEGDEVSHVGNVITFGEFIEPLLKRNKEGRKRYHDLQEIGDLSEQEVNKALDEIAGRHGKYTYDRIKRFVKKVIPEFRDQAAAPQNNDELVAAGTVGVERITWNNEQVPFYRRKAASVSGIYIVKKPLTTDAFDAYPLEKTIFSVGDDFELLDPFSAPFILPGLSERYMLERAAHPDTSLRVPDAMLWIDSSASAPHPAQMSYLVLGGFILANNYMANGAKVGVGNFSTDMLLLAPTYDIDAVHKSLCAYWGGGTVYNIEKFKEWISRLARGRVTEMEVSGREDYENLIDALPEAEQAQFKEKKVSVSLDKEVEQQYQRIDNIMITDGGIWNIEEYIGYLNQIAEHTRNIVFVVGSESEYKRWSAMDLQRTQLVYVKDQQAFANLAIGRAQNLHEVLDAE